MSITDRNAALSPQHLIDCPGLAAYRNRLPCVSRFEGGTSLRGEKNFRHDADRPVISIITIVFNGRDCLERTIRSVLAQTYRNIEFVIIDGGSTDGTQDIIRKYDRDIAYWVSERDHGIGDAFNKGLSVVTGEWIMFLNAADTLAEPDSLEAMSRHVDAAPIISGFSRAGRKIIPKRALLNSDPIEVRAMLSHQASLVHRSLFETYGIFDTSFRIRMDYDFWLRVLQRERFHFLEQIFVDFAARGASNRNLKSYIFEELRVNKKNLGSFRLLSAARLLFYLERFTQ